MQHCEIINCALLKTPHSLYFQPPPFPGFVFACVVCVCLLLFVLPVDNFLSHSPANLDHLKVRALQDLSPGFFPSDS